MTEKFSVETSTIKADFVIFAIGLLGFEFRITLGKGALFIRGRFPGLLK